MEYLQFLRRGLSARQENIGTTAAEGSLVTANRTAGNAFRDSLAQALKDAGRDVQTEVYKWTPFGARFIDIEVSMEGEVLGGVEAKLGDSRYTPWQQLKDLYLWYFNDYRVNVARGPFR